MHCSVSLATLMLSDTIDFYFRSVVSSPGKGKNIWTRKINKSHKEGKKD